MANVQNVLIPDIGGAEDVDVIEILIKAGDEVAVEDSIITLESEKATMEVPSPYAGKIKKVSVKVGDKVSEGSLMCTMEVKGEVVEAKEVEQPVEKAPEKSAAKPTAAAAQMSQPLGGPVYAGPGVRRLAHELSVDLSRVPGTGPKGRIIKQDLYQFVKSAMASGGGSGLAVAAAPKVDFKKFGEIEITPLNKIKRFTAANVHRSWVTAPQVTQFSEADTTDLEAFRQKHKQEAIDQGFKLTPLVFIMKAVVAGLKKFPMFNSSLDATGQNLIMKKYFNIGIAVDTAEGLVVPVIRNVDKKRIYAIAKELGEISQKARDKKLTPVDMSGGCMTISSLGGIGGTAFTPIVNTPEVAILGVSRAKIQAVFVDGEFQPRLMLPLSLTYDHRVIDGADGARFATYVSECLSDIRTLVL